MLVQVYQKTAIPTTTGKYFACHPVDPGGAECEGCTPTLAASTVETVYVLVVGSRIPVAGDYLIAKSIGGRWVASAGRRPTCSMTLFLTRTSNCGAIGATVDFVETATGVTVWSTTITATSGAAVFPFSVQGRAYTINYTYFSISGSISTFGCSITFKSIANPPESGLPNNCYEPMPPALYVTDDWGTHQVWPTPDCFTPPIVGSPYDYTQQLAPTGGCDAPGFSLIYQNWTAGTGCTIPGAGIIAGGSGFVRNCSRPFLYSGTYPTAPPFGPSHPLPNRPFLVHE